MIYLTPGRAFHAWPLKNRRQKFAIRDGKQAFAYKKALATQTKVSYIAHLIRPVHDRTYSTEKPTVTAATFGFNAYLMCSRA